MQMIQELQQHRTYSHPLPPDYPAILLKGTQNGGAFKESTGFSFHLLPTFSIWIQGEVAFPPQHLHPGLKNFMRNTLRGIHTIEFEV